MAEPLVALRKNASLYPPRFCLTPGPHSLGTFFTEIPYGFLFQTPPHTVPLADPWIAISLASDLSHLKNLLLAPSLHDV